MDSNHDGTVGDENGDGLINEADRPRLPPTSLIRPRPPPRPARRHSWTFRNEPHLLAAHYGGDPLREYQQFFRLGVDGVFSDFSDTAVEARRRFAHDDG